MPSPIRLRALYAPAAIALGATAYVLIAGKTGFCPACVAITDTVLGSSSVHVVTTSHQPAESGPKSADEGGFRQVRREGSVDLEAEYNVTGLSIPKDEIHTLLPRDAIPALVDPEWIPVSEAAYLEPTDRLIAVTVNGETLGVPLNILIWHEIVNATVGGVPIAATYCPLCDSATAFERTLRAEPGEDEADPDTLVFGVSGALYNSNVLMYDQSTEGLWSQLALECVSGPYVGRRLPHLPARVLTLAEFERRHPKSPVVSNETGHSRDYENLPYQGFFADAEALLVPVRGIGEALPKKTLGIGILTDAGSWFVPAGAIDGERTIETDAGPVVLRRSEGSLEVVSAAESVRTAQTFYYSWSAFRPQTTVITQDAKAEP